MLIVASQTRLVLSAKQLDMSPSGDHNTLFGRLTRWPAVIRPVTTPPPERIDVVAPDCELTAGVGVPIH